MIGNYSTFCHLPWLLSLHSGEGGGGDSCTPIFAEFYPNFPDFVRILPEFAWISPDFVQILLKFAWIAPGFCPNSRYRSRSRTTVFRRRRAILPKTAHAQNEYSCDTFDNLILASLDILHRRPKTPDFTKKAQVSWMCFIISIDIYTAAFIIR